MVNHENIMHVDNVLYYAVMALKCEMHYL